jgi:hypothetical protein
MKFLLVVFLCLLFGFGVFGQTTETTEKTTVNVENIALMRDDGEGNPGAETEIFKTTDFPIHCQITLDSVKSSTVKMILVAVAVSGLKAETKIMTVNYKTNGEQNIVNFRGSPQNVWLAGKYRVDIFVDNRLAGNKEFTIEKSGASSAGQTNFSPKPKPKPKTKPKRKN